LVLAFTFSFASPPRLPAAEEAAAHEPKESATDRRQNTIVLDPLRVENLGIETAETEESEFEETVFAVGKLEVLPGKRAVVSSRIPGRAFSVLALPDQTVEEGEELMWVESRQPGDPPPTIMLESPISGIIAKVDIVQGQPISPDQALIEVVDLSQLEAAAHVPEHLAGRLAKGQQARIRVSAFPEKVYEAEVAHLSAYAEEDSGTLEAAFHLANEDLALRPGMRAEFTIVTSQREGVLSIPREALQGTAAERFVFIADYELENAFVKTPVVVGVVNDGRAEILSGLLPGDEVVTKGGYALMQAGAGSVSLREALDAAHGHPHNDDGTEMTAEQIAAAGKGGGGGAGRDHEHDHEEGGWSLLTTFFAGTSALLFALLVVSLVLRKRPA
jgi:multidrug efflux pump subunit AcrA (membrane-fusion protein)